MAMDSETYTILEARAARLAKPTGAQAIAPYAVASLIVCRADALSFGVPAAHVVSAIAVDQLGMIPGVSPMVGGLLNFRGTPLLALHPSILLDHARRGLAERTHALVVGHQHAEVALLVDATEQSRSVALETLASPPRDLPERAQRLLLGVTEDGVVVLNVEALLDSDRLLARTYVRRRT
jgi:purine-binding chemotaxis protein CheW